MENSWKIVPVALVLILYFHVFLAIATDDSCPKKEEVIGRDCRKGCESDPDCVSAKKSCLCDGQCGKSCINPNIKCTPVNMTIVNGQAVVLPFNRFGAIAKYTCRDGYEIRGAQARVCQGDETWSDTEPVCVLVRKIEKNECSQPPIVHNAVHDSPTLKQKYPIGTMLEYSCTEGYTPRRESVVRAWCVGGGVWVGPNLTCAHAGCPLLPDIENGKVTVLSQNMIGSRAVYRCDRGYFLAGRMERVCLSDGMWGGREPSCEKVTCPQPQRVQHATFEGASNDQERYPTGTQLTYVCEFGYSKEGDPRAMCSGSGEWVGLTVRCIPRNCGHPGGIENGYRQGYSFEYPHRVIFHCNEGYEMIGGGPMRNCEASGVWSGSTPECIAVECPRLQAPLHGRMIGTGSKYGTTLRFECNPGYHVKGSSSRQCLSDRSWSGNEALCEEINCGWPGAFNNGYLIGDKTTVGAVVFFACNPRTNFDGSGFETHCMENGEWSLPPPNCWGQCQVPTIPNATIMNGVDGDWVRHKTVIRFRCKDGLVPNDTSDVTCYNGTWTDTPHCVPAPCVSGPPHVENGLRVYLGHKHGQKARYICFRGYKLNGISPNTSPFLTCLFGSWTGGTPSCDPFYCPNPGHIKNGKSYKKGTRGSFIFHPYITSIRHGDRVEYKCDAGYKLEGPNGAMCINGHWYPDIKKGLSKCVHAMHPVFTKLWKPLQESAADKR
ncbi:hypothetical protein ScPMuIL_011628 [Solemya velum]